MKLSDKTSTRHRYNFVRWDTKADGTGTSYQQGDVYDHNQEGGKTVILYAQWVQIYTVKYDGNQPVIKRVLVTSFVENQT